MSMKILRKKSLIMLLPIIIVIGGVVAYKFYSNTKEDVSVTNKLTDEKIRQKYIEILSCIPEKPIDKGIIFAEAMKQYWQAEINYLWKRYDRPSEVSMDEIDDVKDVCGLEWNKSWISSDTKTITQDNCYPFIVKDDSSKKVYKPEMDNYIYKPKFYNKDTDFIVLHNTTNKDEKYNNIYPKDCCRLLTYQEMIEEQSKIDENKKIKIYKFYAQNPYYNSQTDDAGYYISDSNLLNNIYFLRVIYTDVVETKFIYYPVSLFIIQFHNTVKFHTLLILTHNHKKFYSCFLTNFFN